jgi:hypothetical protein
MWLAERTATPMAAKANRYSKGLASKVYAGALSMAQNHNRVFFATLPFAVAGLYGPIINPDHNPNGFVFFGGSLVCPCIAAVVLTIFPFRPYRGSPFSPGGPSYDDTGDPDAKRLQLIFTSSQATQFLWRSALRWVLILLALMAILAVLVRHLLEWSWDLPLQTVFLTILACFLSLGAQVMDWGFRAYSATTGEVLAPDGSS